MDAAYNLARWILRDDRDAQDATQDAFLRAWKFFRTFRGGDGRVWLLAIVRNACFTFLAKQRPHEAALPFDDEIHQIEAEVAGPAAALLQSSDADTLRAALEELPAEFRETVVLRELEEMSYKEIAEIAAIPIGTVMSRLARGRRLLQQAIVRRLQEESP